MKRFGKYTLIGWSWRILLGVVLTPILLFLLLLLIVYLPPVQKWAVDKASEELSKELGMEVSVESVRLKFPLDLTMGGMCAVQDGDTIVYADALDVSVRLKPLFDKKVEVDGIRLSDTRLNTKGLIDACSIEGHVGEISLDSHSTDLKQELAVVNKALISDADLYIVLNDSVPEDTTESEPLKWKIQLDDAELRNVKARVLLTPNADSTWVRADVASAHAKALINLGESRYSLHNFAFTDTKVGTSIFANCGMNDLLIKSLEGSANIDTLTIDIPKLSLLTDESKVALSYRMDMNAFADSLPGTFTLATDAQIGKGDVSYFAKLSGESAKDILPIINKWVPAQPTLLTMKAEGNMESLDISTLRLHMPELATIDGSATLWDIADSLTISTSAKATLGKTLAKGGAAKTTSDISLEAYYASAEEAYNIDATLNNVVVNKFVPLDDVLELSGDLSAKGHGFDFHHKGTVARVKGDLHDSHFGKINLSNVVADASLNDNKIALDLSCNNNQLRTDFTLDGTLNRHIFAGKLNIDLPFVDARAMGFSDDRLEASTTGTFDFSYNLDRLFTVESHVDALHLWMGNDSLITDAFYLMLEAQENSTAACLQTGDLDFDFSTPHNALALQPRIAKLTKAFEKQMKDHLIDISILKSYIPELHMHAVAGNQNPVSQILATYGFSFKELVADIDASPATGVSSSGHLYSFKTDSIRIDTTFYTLVQDSTRLNFHAGVSCREQAQLPTFKAYLDGYLGMKDADAHFTYYNKKNEKGIDLGLRATGEDSCHRAVLYPTQPIIAFKRFSLNEDNYIEVPRDGSPTRADIRLLSTTDSCSILLSANENEQNLQEARAVVRHLNIKEILSVLPIPGLPQMAGLLNLDATYNKTDDSFWVAGNAQANNFHYEKMLVGNLGTNFNYVPMGTTAHRIDATLAYNGTDVLKMLGTYDAQGKGSLDADVDVLDAPMSIVSPFIPDQIVGLTGALAGCIRVNGPTDALLVNGELMPKDVHVNSESYSVDLRLDNDSILLTNSRVDFDAFKIYGADDNPLTLNGYVDFSDLNKMLLSLSLYGRNFKLVEAKRANKKVLFGNMYGDFFARVNGTSNDLTVRGLVNVLPTTDITYIMTETPLSQGDRLDDIVTFVDFSTPPDTTVERERKQFMGIDMNMVLSIQDGAQFHCEFSSDKQSYVNVQGGGSVTMTYTPEGVLNLQGRYTLNEGEMKYTLPVIPLKTFNIQNGSYIEFTGNPMNPTLNIAATERTRATVGQDGGASRSVSFDVGLKISNTLDDMGLAFTIEAPEDLNVQNELASLSSEEKNKLAVAMLATGMYLSGSNSKGFSAGNALNNFLQNEINNIAGKALNTMVNVDMGLEQTTRDDGTTRTDYAFQFSRRFFSDRLNVVIGGKVNTDGNTEQNESGAYIDDVSLEWRLDNGGSQYVRLFHEKDYSNLIEGELDKNGAGVLLRTKVDKFSDLFLWAKPKKKEENNTKATKAEENITTKKKEDK